MSAQSRQLGLEVRDSVVPVPTIIPSLVGMEVVRFAGGAKHSLAVVTRRSFKQKVDDNEARISVKPGTAPSRASTCCLAVGYGRLGVAPACLSQFLALWPFVSASALR